MAFTFFKRTAANPVALKKPAPVVTPPPAAKQPVGYKMTLKDWVFSIGSFGVYYCAVIMPKKAQAQEQSRFQAIKPPQPELKTREPGTPAQPEIKQKAPPAEKIDPWQGIFANLCLLQEPLARSLERGALPENFDAFENLVATCSQHDFLKAACAAFRSADSTKDALTRQLDFIKAVTNAACVMMTSSNASLSYKESLTLDNKYAQLRTKIIFKQASPLLDSQLQQPKAALNNLEAELEQLTTDTPSFRKLSDEPLDYDEKPYNKNALPELSSQNDPIQYLKKRLAEFNATQRQLQATLTRCGIDDLAITECHFTEIADSEENAEEKLKAALEKTHNNTLSVLEQLKSRPTCAACTGEIHNIIKDYSPVVEQITRGATLAATYRQAQLRHTIRQNPALMAYYEELKRLLQSKIIGAAAASSGEVAAAKSTELTIIEEAALSVQQLPLPGVGIAASIVSSLYGYVEQVRQGTKLSNILAWYPHLSDKNWLEEFALLATIGKRKEILDLAAKAQAEVDNTKRIKTLEKSVAELPSAISAQESTTKQLQKTATAAEKTCAQKERDIKKRSVSLKQAKVHQDKIDHLTKDIGGQIKKTHNGDADRVWQSIQNGAIKSPQDPQLVSASIPRDVQKNFKSYVHQHNEKTSAEQAFSRTVATDKTLQKLKEQKQSAARAASTAEQQLEKLKNTLAQTKAELEQLKAKLATWKEKLAAASTQLKQKVGGLKDQMDHAINSGLEKYKEDQTEASAGKAVAIQDFAHVMTQIASSPDPVDNTADSATSRLLAYLPKDPKAAAADVGFDPAKTNGKDLKGYFFYDRTAKTESTVASRDNPIVIKEDHFADKGASIAASPSMVASVVQTNYFGSRRKPDETKPLLPDEFDNRTVTTAAEGAR